jgi:hypothetical protein
MCSEWYKNEAVDMTVLVWTEWGQAKEARSSVLTLVITNSAAPGLAPAGAGAAAAVAIVDRCMGS